MTSLTTIRNLPAKSAKRNTISASKNNDIILIVATAILASFGLVLVYSASSVFAAKYYGDAEHFLIQQTVWCLIGVIALYATSKTNSIRLYQMVPWLLLLTLICCALVLIPGIGKHVNGAQRRLDFGFFGFQPSEFCKLTIILALARILERRESKPMQERVSLIGPVLLLQIPVLFILIEPDLGTALVIELIIGITVFVAGVRVRTLALFGLAALPILYHLIVATPFRLRRLLSYIDPWAYRSTVGYQITESLISIGSGGITGVGLGGGKHKLFFLPEAHTDFVFAIVGEELGLLGIAFLLLVFGVFIWRAIHIAMQAKSVFEGYLALGLTSLVGVPVLFNTGVATGLLPTKGLALPFISYGGSNLVVTFIAVGLLLSVARNSSVNERRFSNRDCQKLSQKRAATAEGA
ncbi:MAG: putative lipid II flippase FtsW [Deltaproteobacteria bacterium]|nr:putative lipid II flippase FtsW [Deltaproteobacteria bacterium]